jgi:hypothetical protein
MPIKQKDWAKILQGVGAIGQTISGVVALKEARKQQELQDQRNRVAAQTAAEYLKRLIRENRLAALKEKNVSEALYQRQTGSTGQIGEVPLGTTIPLQQSVTAGKTAGGGKASMQTLTAKQLIERARKINPYVSTAPAPAPEFREDIIQEIQRNPAALMQFVQNPNASTMLANLGKLGLLPGGKDSRSEWERDLDALWEIEKIPEGQRTGEQILRHSALNQRVFSSAKKENPLIVQGRVIRNVTDIYGDLGWAKLMRDDPEQAYGIINAWGERFVGKDDWIPVLSLEEMQSALNAVNLPRNKEEARSRYGG